MYSQLTKTKAKAAKKDSLQRGMITRLRTHLDVCNKENDELRINQQEHKRQIDSQQQKHDKVVRGLCSDIRQLQKEKTTLRKEKEAVERKVSQQTNKLDSLLTLSKHMQESYNKLYEDYSKQALGTFEQDVQKLQAKLCKIVRREQAWVDKVQAWEDKVHDSRRKYRTIQGRIKLVKTKKKMQAMIKDLRSKLKRQKERTGMAAVMKELSHLKEENARLANENEILKEERSDHQDVTGPEWLTKMPLAGAPRQEQYPDELVEDAMTLMGRANTPASQVVLSIKTVLSRCTDVMKYRWPRNNTLGRWRASMLHLVRVQIGWILTTACRAGDHLWTLSQDGTPENQRHVEAFVIELQNGRIGGIPWLQGNKAGLESAFGCVAELRRCHAAYQDLYEWAIKCKLSAEMPEPVDVRLVC